MKDLNPQPVGARTMGDPGPNQATHAPPATRSATALPSPGAPAAPANSPAAAIETNRAALVQAHQEMVVEPNNNHNAPTAPAGSSMPPNPRGPLPAQAASAAPGATDPNALGFQADGQYAFMEGNARRVAPAQHVQTLIQEGISAQAGAQEMAGLRQSKSQLDNLQQVIAAHPQGQQAFAAFLHGMQTGTTPNYGTAAPAAPAAPATPAAAGDAAYAGATNPPAEGTPAPTDAYLQHIAQLEQRIAVQGQQMQALSQTQAQSLETQRTATEEQQFRTEFGQIPWMGTGELLDFAVTAAHAMRQQKPLEPLPAIVREVASQEEARRRAYMDQQLNQTEQLRGIPAILPSGHGSPVLNAGDKPHTMADLNSGATKQRAEGHMLAALLGVGAPNPLNPG